MWPIIKKIKATKEEIRETMLLVMTVLLYRQLTRRLGVQSKPATRHSFSFAKMVAECLLTVNLII
jgi:hypothetical protein